MEAFDRLTATAAPYEPTNVDTDQIIPARYLRHQREEGYGQFLFRDLRYNDDGSEKPEFLLNQAAWRDSGILVANSNFACGSSREGAVFALVDAGIRCVIAPSFGDIFYNNCFKNGLLPIRLAPDQVTELRAALAASPGAKLSVDLKTQLVTGPGNYSYQFEIEPFGKECLLKGLDDISLTQEYGADIAKYEGPHYTAQPWVSEGTGRD